MSQLRNEIDKGEWHYGGQTLVIKEETNKNVKLKKKEDKLGLRSLFGAKAAAEADRMVAESKDKHIKGK